ncbi:MAG TPA: hypothetical protein VK995_04665, partial [Oceanipulchritudo sp.]|nr:hypothetical protein [Oceanipulchritudo sp.]
VRWISLPHGLDTADIDKAANAGGLGCLKHPPGALYDNRTIGIGSAGGFTYGMSLAGQMEYGRHPGQVGWGYIVTGEIRFNKPFPWPIHGMPTKGHYPVPIRLQSLAQAPAEKAGGSGDKRNSAPIRHREMFK